MTTNLNSKPIFASIKSTLNLDAMSILTSPQFLANQSTLIDQHALIADLFDNVETKSRLEPIADRILNLTVASPPPSSFCSSNQECCLRYLKLCTPYCSTQQIDRLFENFLAQLAETIAHHDTKRMNFLISYLDVLTHSKRLDFTNPKRTHRERGQALVRTSVELLSSDERALSKLAIALLERLAAIEIFRASVLDQCLTVIAATSRAVAACNNNKKKRLESHVGVLELSLATGLADQIFNSDSNNNTGGNDTSCCCYLGKIEFWTLVQHGLVHTNPLSRRQALYLLKRANDFATRSRQNDDKLKLKLNATFIVDNTKSDPVYMYRADWRAWNDFFLCIEVLEETSV